VDDTPAVGPKTMQGQNEVLEIHRVSRSSSSLLVVADKKQAEASKNGYRVSRNRASDFNRLYMRYCVKVRAVRFSGIRHTVRASRRPPGIRNHLGVDVFGRPDERPGDGMERVGTIRFTHVSVPIRPLSRYTSCHPLVGLRLLYPLPPIALSPRIHKDIMLVCTARDLR